ncbi:YceI family protein [Flavobacterium crassostreae]|uniref:Lipid/polyisoprenoid-binding YceI-like domain-containing protein n=1 Tax=Flavobacterium crassostreae TaxID=1763534 RepID=A0A1B9DX97_9FLAO|nr:YceI family protein [Flavobacterium crassostreae]OCB74316.1 hypothetical protein LPBF_09950 [Flavobacterium crassostreae]
MIHTLPIAPTKWWIDPIQSDVLIKARHSVVAYISGSLNKFSGYIDVQDNQVQDASIEFILDIKNQAIALENVDGPMLSNDYLDTDGFPFVSFKSLSFQKINPHINFLKGALTINNTTKIVELEAELLDIKTCNGSQKALFEITGKINRKDFQLTTNSYKQAGGIVLGPDVKLIANLEFTV